MDSETYERYVTVLKEHLSDRRLKHSLEVAKSAGYLAKKYGGDEEKMYEAGLLHDITKEADKSESFYICKKYCFELSELEKNSPKLWHAITGSLYIKNILGVTDEDILTSVRYHTTGRKNMTLSEKILFIADFISADRDYDDVDVIRKKSEKSLEEAMLYGLSYTISELAQRNSAIHPDTIEAYNDIIINYQLKGLI